MDNEIQPAPVNFKFFPKCCYCGRRKQEVTGKRIAKFLKSKGKKVATPCCIECFEKIGRGETEAEIKGSEATARYHAAQVMHFLERLEAEPDYDVLLALLKEMKFVNQSLGELGHEFKRRSQEVQIMARRLTELQGFVESTGFQLAKAVSLTYKECRKVADREIADPVLRKRIFARDCNQCRHCGATKLLTIDHIVPVYFNGTSDDSNLQTLCLTCNSSKGKTLPDIGKQKADEAKRLAILTT